MIYVREAHAIDGEWPMDDGPKVEEPATLDERKANAGACAGALDMAPLRMLVDDMKDTACRAYAAWPDRLYLVDEKGRVTYAGGPGPKGFLPDELEEAILELLPEPKRKE